MIAGRASTVENGRIVGQGDGARRSHAGKAPCVVLFHGFGGTTSEIAPLIDAIVKDGYAIEAPLLPGHGTRAEELQDTSFEDMVEAMEPIVRASVERYGRVVLAGFSLGSLVAMELAARDLPGVEALIVLGNAIELVGPLRGVMGLVDRRGWKLPDWYLVKFWNADLRDPDMRKRIVTYDRNPLRASLQVHRGGTHVKTRLRNISLPTLILHGVKDRVCPVANAELVRAGLGSRDIVVRTYAKSAHVICCDHDREAVAQDVLDFLHARQ